MNRVPCHAALLALATACSGPDEAALKRAAEKALALYQPASDVKLEVRQAVPRHGLIQVTLQRGSAQEFVDVFISQDGAVFTESLRDVDSSIRELANDRRFADCLKDAGVAVFTRGADEASTQQARVLGRFASRVTIRCETDPANCAAAGIQELPSVKHGGKVHGGMHTLAWFETLTGCKR